MTVLLQLIFAAALLYAVLIVLRDGLQEDRVGMAIVIGGSLATLLMTLGSSWQDTNMMLVVLDVGMLVGFVALAIRGHRFWPMYAAAWQTIGVSTHVAKMLSEGLLPAAYANGASLWGYLILAAIIWEVGRFPERMIRPHLAGPGH